MAVDYGSEALKVSVVKAGRPPINIVINELSKRRTSAEVNSRNYELVLLFDSVKNVPCCCNTHMPSGTSTLYLSCTNMLGRYACMVMHVQSPLAVRMCVLKCPFDYESQASAS